MAAELAAIVTPTAYRVSCLPEGRIDGELWDITVELRSHGRWSVRHNTKSLGVDGEWSHGPLQDEDATRWVKAHRFDLDTALQLAREVAPHVTVNGLTAADVFARHTTRAAVAAPETTEDARDRATPDAAELEDLRDKAASLAKLNRWQAEVLREVGEAARAVVRREWPTSPSSEVARLKAALRRLGDREAL